MSDDDFDLNAPTEEQRAAMFARVPETTGNRCQPSQEARKAPPPHTDGSNEGARPGGEETGHIPHWRSAFQDLGAEVARATAKFPEGRTLLEALCEELGEAAREPDPGRPGNVEWLQVACVAMRLYVEGAPDIGAAEGLRLALVALEGPAREVLDR